MTTTDRIQERRFSRRMCVCAIFAVMITSRSVRADDSLEIKNLDVYPKRITLHSTRRPMRLIARADSKEGFQVDVTKKVILRSSDDRIVRVNSRRVIPVANGSATINVSFGKFQQSVAVTVSLQESDPVSLHNEVLPILSRQGCSSGACHGSPKGKGGFRLSLRAFDPSIDESTLRSEFFARRTNPLNPDTSLLLRKPLTDVPHAGGRRLQSGSTSHRILRQWIAEGTRLDSVDAPRCESIELYPKDGCELRTDAPSQNFAVYATFSNGAIHDITDLVVFTSSDSSVAEVDASGVVTRIEGTRGQTAITVRYLEHMATAFVLSVPQDDSFSWPEPPEANYIDRLVHNRLMKLQYPPSARCSDAEFFRRVYLDVTGLLPSVAATREFLADNDSAKRSELIDRLLMSPQHAKFMALKWGDVLRIRTANVTSTGVFKYYRWLVRAFARNMRYDEFSRQLLTSSGSTFENPTANYFRTAANTNDATESTAQVFLGARLECAKCHNHPHERWTQDNYYGLGAFFNRIQRDPTERKDEFVISVAASGEVTQPRTGVTMKPWLPGDGDVEIASSIDRRTVFAKWLTNPENPIFARVEVNRLWSQLMGQGIVEPIDDFRDSNPPSNSELLDALARDFVEHDFDRRHILRTILNSETYQRASKPNAANENDDRYFSRYHRRLLSAEQLLDAICDVTEVSEQFANLPNGMRATQLPSPDFGKSFLKIFGQPERKTVCRCERSEDLNLTQALQVANGSFVNNKVNNGNNRIRRLLKAKKSLPEIVEDCYLAAYTRLPTQQEIKTVEDFFNSRRGQSIEQAYEDLLWSVLNSNEFLFQH